MIDFEMKRMARDLARDTRGGSMIEYALVLFAVLLCGAVAVRMIGPKIIGAGQGVTNTVQAGNGGGGGGGGGSGGGGGGGGGGAGGGGAGGAGGGANGAAGAAANGAGGAGVAGGAGASGAGG